MAELIDKSTAMYYSPEAIGSADGARCNVCWKFNLVDKTCIEVEGKISGPRGICGLYVYGAPWGHAVTQMPSRKVTKEEASYSENGPTHCANCDEMMDPKVYGTSPCRKVKGPVDGRACCNLWNPA